MQLAKLKKKLKFLWIWFEKILFSTMRDFILPQTEDVEKAVQDLMKY